MKSVVSPANLRLLALGTLTLESETGPVHLATRKAAALLTYLAVQGEWVSRAELAALFWPEHTEEQARRSLRQELFRLVHVLRTGSLEVERERVRLLPVGLDVDVWAFWKARAEGRHSDATGLYRGSLLQGIHLRDAAPFETWLATAREALQRDFLDSLAAVSQSLELQGRNQESLTIIRRAIAIDPLAEDFYVEAMRLAYRAGDRAGALRIYQALEQELHRELAVEPGAEARALASEIQSGTPIPPRLPSPSMPLVGRHKEILEVRSFLAREDCRLLSLVGPGGVGKTRLALAFAQELQGSPVFSQSVYWIELRGPHLYPSLGDALGLPLYGRGDQQGAVLHRLRNQRLLLILDEAEKLAEETHLLETLLDAAPQIKVLTTSRESLRFRGEWVYHLHGLPVPQPEGPVEQSPAAELFLRAAERVRPGFLPTPEDWAAIGAIARMLDGLPLGLELAASWVRILACREIQHELERGLDFLEGALPHLPVRQRSLRAVTDSMLARLSSAERDTLVNVSIFRDGCTLEVGREVAGATPTRLAEIADKALIRRGPLGRYQVLELVRQRLVAEVPFAIREAHAVYYAGFLQRREQPLRGGSQPEALNEVGAEIVNVREAWTWSLDEQRADLASMMMGGLFLFHELRGWFREGEEIFARACQLPDPTVASRALSRCGRFQYRLGKYHEAETSLQKGLALARASGHQDEMAFALNNLGLVALGLGQPHVARGRLHESLDLRRKAGSQWDAANSVFNLGLVAIALGDYIEALARFQEAQDLYRSLGDARGMSLALGGLGQASTATGEYSMARELYDQALGLGEQLGDPLATASALLGVGWVAWLQGHVDVGRNQLEASLKAFQAVGDRSGITRALLALARMAAQQGDAHRAGDLGREALELSEQAGFRSGHALALTHLGYAALALGDRDEARVRLRMALGQTLELQVVPLVLRVFLVASRLLEPTVRRAMLDFVREHPGSEHEVKVEAQRLADALPAAKAVPADLNQATAIVSQALQTSA